MKNWKIKNLSEQQIKFVAKLGAETRGIVLNPKELCIIDPQMTSFIEIQERRGFINVDREFDNSNYNLEPGTVYSEDVLKTKLEQARENAKKYIDKK